MNNTVAIVTGASRGIGRSTAIRLARDFSAVVLAARNADGIFCTEDPVTLKGFLRTGSGAIITGDVFNSGYTEGYSINAKNVITGYYEDSNSVMHGFLLIP